MNNQNTQSKPCTFCSIPAIKERTILENKLAFAFLTNIPIVPGHTLISPKRCVANFEDMTTQEKDAIFDLASQLKKAYQQIFIAQGFNVAYNQGGVAGQSGPHFHLHLLPRKQNDTGITEYELRKFLYRPGSREISPESELASVAEIIKKHFSK